MTVDVMRRVYQPISEEQKHDADELKRMMNEMFEHLVNLSNKYSEAGGRELAIARTNLEQASMWAVKGVTATV